MELKWNQDGLIPVIVQDYKNHEVLMMAYMNKEAFQKTLSTKKLHFYSRSRKQLWLKGESSGHTQELKEMLTDCDQDTLLIKAKQKGGACHLGYRTCFVHPLDETGKLGKPTQAKVFDPDAVYKK